MNPAQPNSLAAWLTMRPGSLRREDLGPRAGGLRPVLCGDAMRPIPPLTPMPGALLFALAPNITHGLRLDNAARQFFS